MLLTTSFPFEGQEEDGGDDQRAARPADGRKVFMPQQPHPKGSEHRLDVADDSGFDREWFTS